MKKTQTIADLYSRLDAARSMTGRGAAFRERQSRAVASALGSIGAAARQAAAAERKQAAQAVSEASQRVEQARAAAEKVREQAKIAPDLPEAKRAVSDAAARARKLEDRLFGAQLQAAKAGSKGALERAQKAGAKTVRDLSAEPAPPPKAKLARGGSRANRQALRESVESGGPVKGYRTTDDESADFYYGVATWIDKNTGNRRWAITQRAESRADAEADLEAMVSEYGAGGKSGANSAASTVCATVRAR